MDDATISYETEHSILCYIQGLWDGEFKCARCFRQLDATTGWKPYVGFLARQGGLHTVITYLVCGPCIPAANVEQQAQKHGTDTDE